MESSARPRTRSAADFRPEAFLSLEALKELRQRDAADGGRPGAFERRRLRRRLDRQERVREALLLDLGAIVFELRLQGRSEPELLHAKEIELRAVDREVRGLADGLEEGLGLPELTASGLVAACTACSRLMGSRDRFCPACGAAAGASEAAKREGDPAPPMREPDFGNTIEVSALNAAGHPALDEHDDDEELEELDEDQPEEDRSDGSAELAAAWGRPPWSAPSPAHGPGTAQALVPRAQRKLRAGRRIARQWLEQRRPDGP
jgi:hypothetical protein